ncbi:hypothetical protein ABZ557_20660 [Streptomyces sp. NPDC019645]|uniref:hypothetical protein n=1 Tax=unclassified Streptomyces TaxID=2593676 RepID=UPI0033F978EA
MPRPTAAQLAYGSATVVVSTVAMLLVSRATTALGVAVVGVTALALGLLVAVSVPVPDRAKAARTAGRSRAAAVEDRSLPADSSSRVPVAHAADRHRVGQHSGRR